jgi:hypothetical protein
VSQRPEMGRRTTHFATVASRRISSYVVADLPYVVADLLGKRYPSVRSQASPSSRGPRTASTEHGDPSKTRTLSREEGPSR